MQYPKGEKFALSRKRKSMSELKLGGEYLREGFTEIDNVFLSRYLPEADAVDVKVYLYGLYLALHGGGNASDVALAAARLTPRMAPALVN